MHSFVSATKDKLGKRIKEMLIYPGLGSLVSPPVYLVNPPGSSNARGRLNLFE